jgi:hypothetical protein
MYGTVLCERENGDVREGCHSWIHVFLGLMRRYVSGPRVETLVKRLARGVWRVSAVNLETSNYYSLPSKGRSEVWIIEFDSPSLALLVSRHTSLQTQRRRKPYPRPNTSHGRLILKLSSPSRVAVCRFPFYADTLLLLHMLRVGAP